MHSYSKCATTHKESACHHFLPSSCSSKQRPAPQTPLPRTDIIKTPTPSHPVSGPQHMTHILPEVKVHQHNKSHNMYPLSSPFTAHAAMSYIMGPWSKVTHTYISCNLPSKYQVSPLHIVLQSTRDCMSHVNISCNMNQCSRPAPSFPDGLHRTIVT